MGFENQNQDIENSKEEQPQSIQYDYSNHQQPGVNSQDNVENAPEIQMTQIQPTMQMYQPPVPPTMHHQQQMMPGIQPPMPMMQQQQYIMPQEQMQQNWPEQQMTTTTTSVQTFSSSMPHVYAAQPWEQNYLHPQGPDPYGFNGSGYSLGLQPQDFMFGQQMQQNTNLIHGMGLREAQMPIYPQLQIADMSGYMQLSVLQPAEDYQGATVNGMKHGVGGCTWPDGSKYEGDWQENLRHGNGKYTHQGQTYLGQWQQDLKHGRGQLTEEDGTIIKGSWMHDKLNGLASLQKKGSSSKETVIYREGMQILLTKDMNGSTVGYVIFSVLMMLAFYAAIPLAFYFKNPHLFLIMLVCLIYIICSCCTDSCKYINNLVELPQVFKDIAQAIKNAPSQSFNIACYHWETRTHKDSKGNTRTSRHKKYTHHAKQNFNCTAFVDQSPSPGVLHYLDMLKLARLHTTKIIHLTPAAQSRQSGEKQQFISNNNRDQHYEFSLEEDIPGHLEHCLVYNPKEGEKPWFTNYWLLVVLDVFLLGWIQRLKLDTQTFKVEYTLKKLVLR